MRDDVGALLWMAAVVVFAFAVGAVLLSAC